MRRMGPPKMPMQRSLASSMPAKAPMEQGEAMRTMHSARPTPFKKKKAMPPQAGGGMAPGAGYSTYGQG